MKYNQLGNTGMFVSEICLGTMTFGGDGFWKVVGELDQKNATAIVARSLEAGVNFLDTAASNGCRPTTSTFTRSTPPTASRPSRRRCEHWTT